MSEIDSGAPKEMKKYQTYYINVDPDQDDKATELKLCSFARPHMRAFHCAWWAFFVAFCIWFAIAPLLTEVKTSLKLTKEEIWTSNIIGVGGTIFMRFILGPGCDKFGARILFAALLCTASIPTACTGLVNSAAGLYVLRLFIGIAGGTFVTTQFWTSRMFTKEVVGTANAIAAGWGNLGAGAISLIMGAGIFPLFKLIFNGNADLAWRWASVVPAVVGFATGVIIYFISDDAPKGNYAEMKKHGIMPEISAAVSFRSGAVNINTWILFVQYAACFGVELTMNNAAALYFKEQFSLTTESAAAIASIFGWMNLFARGLGGYICDKSNQYMGMKGRIISNSAFLFFEGLFVLVFANSTSLASAIVVMVFFSLFVQCAEGSTFGIVPYINPAATGSVSGIVGAGGNVGAVLFGLCFRQMDYKSAFYVVGGCVLASSLMGLFIVIKGQSSFICGGTDTVEKEVPSSTLAVPEVDVSAKKTIEEDTENDAELEAEA
ncbi:hypothetical protein MHU86_5511 [Fragilaria crotonensis]|nr:hypothetical protein MHU86_5511 [Fragilaria crotonensis]